jgi:hypothetical protein
VKSKLSSSPSRARPAVLELPPALPGHPLPSLMQLPSRRPPSQVTAGLPFASDTRKQTPAGLPVELPKVLNFYFVPDIYCDSSPTVDLALPASRPRAPSDLPPSILRHPPPTSMPLCHRPHTRVPAGLPSLRSSSCRPRPRALAPAAPSSRSPLAPPASSLSSSAAKSMLPSPRTTPMTKTD